MTDIEFNQSRLDAALRQSLSSRSLYGVRGLLALGANPSVLVTSPGSTRPALAHVLEFNYPMDYVDALLDAGAPLLFDKKELFGSRARAGFISALQIAISGQNLMAFRHLCKRGAHAVVKEPDDLWLAALATKKPALWLRELSSVLGPPGEVACSGFLVHMVKTNDPDFRTVAVPMMSGFPHLFDEKRPLFDFDFRRFSARNPAGFWSATEALMKGRNTQSDRDRLGRMLCLPFSFPKLTPSRATQLLDHPLVSAHLSKSSDFTVGLLRAAKNNPQFPEILEVFERVGLRPPDVKLGETSSTYLAGIFPKAATLLVTAPPPPTDRSDHEALVWGWAKRSTLSNGNQALLRFPAKMKF